MLRALQRREPPQRRLLARLAQSLRVRRRLHGLPVRLRAAVVGGRSGGGGLLGGRACVALLTLDVVLEDEGARAVHGVQPRAHLLHLDARRHTRLGRHPLHHRGKVALQLLRRRHRVEDDRRPQPRECDEDDREGPRQVGDDGVRAVDGIHHKTQEDDQTLNEMRLAVDLVHLLHRVAVQTEASTGRRVTTGAHKHSLAEVVRLGSHMEDEEQHRHRQGHDELDEAAPEALLQHQLDNHRQRKHVSDLQQPRDGDDRVEKTKLVVRHAAHREEHDGQNVVVDRNAHDEVREVEGQRSVEQAEPLEHVELPVQRVHVEAADLLGSTLRKLALEDVRLRETRLTSLVHLQELDVAATLSATKHLVARKDVLVRVHLRRGLRRATPGACPVPVEEVRMPVMRTDAQWPVQHTLVDGDEAPLSGAHELADHTEVARVAVLRETHDAVRRDQHVVVPLRQARHHPVVGCLEEVVEQEGDLDALVRRGVLVHVHGLQHLAACELQRMDLVLGLALTDLQTRHPLHRLARPRERLHVLAEARRHGVALDVATVVELHLVLAHVPVAPAAELRERQLHLLPAREQLRQLLDRRRLLRAAAHRHAGDGPATLAPEHVALRREEAGVALHEEALVAVGLQLQAAGLERLRRALRARVLLRHLVHGVYAHRYDVLLVLALDALRHHALQPAAADDLAVGVRDLVVVRVADVLLEQLAADVDAHHRARRQRTRLRGVGAPRLERVELDADQLVLLLLDAVHHLVAALRRLLDRRVLPVLQRREQQLVAQLPHVRLELRVVVQHNLEVLLTPEHLHKRVLLQHVVVRRVLRAHTRHVEGLVGDQQLVLAGHELEDGRRRHRAVLLQDGKLLHAEAEVAQPVDRPRKRLSAHGGPELDVADEGGVGGIVEGTWVVVAQEGVEQVVADVVAVDHPLGAVLLQHLLCKVLPLRNVGQSEVLELGHALAHHAGVTRLLDHRPAQQDGLVVHGHKRRERRCSRHPVRLAPRRREVVRPALLVLQRSRLEVALVCGQRLQAPQERDHPPLRLLRARLQAEVGHKLLGERGVGLQLQLQPPRLLLLQLRVDLLRLRGVLRRRTLDLQGLDGLVQARLLRGDLRRLARLHLQGVGLLPAEQVVLAHRVDEVVPDQRLRTAHTLDLLALVLLELHGRRPVALEQLAQVLLRAHRAADLRVQRAGHTRQRVLQDRRPVALDVVPVLHVADTQVLCPRHAEHEEEELEDGEQEDERDEVRRDPDEDHTNVAHHVRPALTVLDLVLVQLHRALCALAHVHPHVIDRRDEHQERQQPVGRKENTPEDDVREDVVRLAEDLGLCQTAFAFRGGEAQGQPTADHKREDDEGAEGDVLVHVRPPVPPRVVHDVLGDKNDAADARNQHAAHVAQTHPADLSRVLEATLHGAGLQSPPEQPDLVTSRVQEREHQVHQRHVDGEPRAQVEHRGARVVRGAVDVLQEGQVRLEGVDEGDADEGDAVEGRLDLQAALVALQDDPVEDAAQEAQRRVEECQLVHQEGRRALRRAEGLHVGRDQVLPQQVAQQPLEVEHKREDAAALRERNVVREETQRLALALRTRLGLLLPRRTQTRLEELVARRRLHALLRLARGVVLQVRAVDRVATVDARRLLRQQVTLCAHGERQRLGLRRGDGADRDRLAADGGLLALARLAEVEGVGVDVVEGEALCHLHAVRADDLHQPVVEVRDAQHAVLPVLLRRLLVDQLLLVHLRQALEALGRPVQELADLLGGVVDGAGPLLDQHVEREGADAVGADELGGHRRLVEVEVEPLRVLLVHNADRLVHQGRVLAAVVLDHLRLRGDAEEHVRDHVQQLLLRDAEVRVLLLRKVRRDEALDVAEADLALGLTLHPPALELLVLAARRGEDPERVRDVVLEGRDDLVLRALARRTHLRISLVDAVDLPAGQRAASCRGADWGRHEAVRLLRVFLVDDHDAALTLLQLVLLVLLLLRGLRRRLPEADGRLEHHDPVALDTAAQDEEDGDEDQDGGHHPDEDKVVVEVLLRRAVQLRPLCLVLEARGHGVAARRLAVPEHLLHDAEGESRADAHVHALHKLVLRHQARLLLEQAQPLLVQEVRRRVVVLVDVVRAVRVEVRALVRAAGPPDVGKAPLPPLVDVLHDDATVDVHHVLLVALRVGGALVDDLEPLAEAQRLLRNVLRNRLVRVAENVEGLLRAGLVPRVAPTLDERVDSVLSEDKGLHGKVLVEAVRRRRGSEAAAGRLQEQLRVLLRDHLQGGRVTVDLQRPEVDLQPRVVLLHQVLQEHRVTERHGDGVAHGVLVVADGRHRVHNREQRVVLSRERVVQLVTDHVAEQRGVVLDAAHKRLPVREHLAVRLGRVDGRVDGWRHKEGNQHLQPVLVAQVHERRVVQRRVPTPRPDHVRAHCSDDRDVALPDVVSRGREVVELLLQRVLAGGDGRVPDTLDLKVLAVHKHPRLRGVQGLGLRVRLAQHDRHVARLVPVREARRCGALDPAAQRRHHTRSGENAPHLAVIGLCLAAAAAAALLGSLDNHCVVNEVQIL
eukprot:Rhum_TRINITY_DN14308_c5_g2::Rhum_TRINITY_DN14308_c5_g2_i1::g.80789::m.80789